MEEKKLTDEEILISALCCMAGQKACDLCRYDDRAMQDGERTCINLVAEDTLELLYQKDETIAEQNNTIFDQGAVIGQLTEETVKQKAEIERLTGLCSKSSYKDSWKKKFFKAQEEIKRLTEEEYEELQKGIKTYNYTAMFDAQAAYRWEQGYLQGRNETVDKFAEMAKERKIEMGTDGHSYCMVFVEDIDEIAKEITGE